MYKKRSTMTNHLQDKFLLYLNSSLAMENAALERVQRRVQQTTLEDARQQLQNHLEETKQHQDRLRQLITKIGGVTPTQEKGNLPIAMPPDSIRNVMHPSMIPEEQELMQSVEDTIVESAEVIGYNLLIQMAGKMNKMDDTIPLLRQSLYEEEKMFTWLRANAPAMFAKLWPHIAESSSSQSCPSNTTKMASSSYEYNKEQISNTASAAAENIPPEVFDSSTYDSMAEIKKSATMNESEANRVLLDTEKKEPIQPAMTTMEHKNKNNTKVSSTATSTTVNPTMEGRASTLKQSREKERIESAADKKRQKQKNKNKL
jgi:ferritin-like metal-binding protein YciE